MNDIDKATLEKIETPPMEGWCTVAKACDLFEIVEKYQPETCLEIGTFGGRSMVAIALALKKLGRGIVFGIDPWKVEACVEGSNPEENNQWWSNVPWQKIIASYFDKLQEFDVLGYVAHFRKHDTECLGYFRKSSIDLIHFDSNHSQEVACRTVKDWWPKLSKNAVIIMDDIDWSGQNKALELMKELGVETIKEEKTYGIYKRS